MTENENNLLEYYERTIQECVKQCDGFCSLRDKECECVDANVLDHLKELQAYRAIGTIDEFKALKEKNEPKKIDIWANGEEHCPFCDKNLTTFYGFANCFSCGQKLDWQ